MGDLLMWFVYISSLKIHKTKNLKKLPAVFFGRSVFLQRKPPPRILEEGFTLSLLARVIN